MFWRRRSSGDPLDRKLFHWPSGEPFTVRQLLDGGVSVIGRVGSGKTSSSGKHLGRAIVNHPNSCGLISAAKPEDVGMWREIFAEAGRSEDLLEFDADGDLRFNFLAEAMRHGGHTREITRCIITIAETLRSGDRGRGEDSAFWEREQERMIYNAVEVIKIARKTVTAQDLQAFVTTAAYLPGQLREPTWRDGFHSRCLQTAYQTDKSPTEAQDFQLAADYWCSEIPNMADRTRSSILTGVLGLLHVFNTGLVRELVSNGTNVSPDDMLDQRKWVLVNLPPASYGSAGTFINAGWKYLTQRRVLRREARPGDPFHVCWVDEAQQFVNSFDGEYLAQCRSHLGCLVFLTQSLQSYFSALKGEGGKHQAKALLANFGHRVVHALGDIESANWASALIGNRLETFLGGSMQPAQSVFDELLGHQQFSGNFSTKLEPVLQPSVFMNGLRTGGARNRFLCDAIVIKSGEPFASGQNWMRIAFSQR